MNINNNGAGGNMNKSYDSVWSPGVRKSPLFRRVTMSDMHSLKMTEELQQAQTRGGTIAEAPELGDHKTVRRSSSIGEDDKPPTRPSVRHNSWPANKGEPQQTSPRGPVSPRGPMKSHLGRMKDDSLKEVNENDASGDEPWEAFPEAARQREIIERADTECTCTYAVSKMWYHRWEEYVGVPKGMAPGASDSPGPIEMDTHNDGNNEYVNEEIWKRLVHWYGVSLTHQLDRKHLYFKDEKMFDICVLSPFSGIVEHNVKKFNRFEEIGYIECQLRRVFHVPDHKKSRLWISEKAQVPRFRQLLLRFRMLNDCIHRDKVYILALEECVSKDAWPTGEPGEPKGDLTKYKELIAGPKDEEYWNAEVEKNLVGLTETVTETLREGVKSFLQNTKSMMSEKELSLDDTRVELDQKLEKTRIHENELETRANDVTTQEEDLDAARQKLETERDEFEQKKEKFTEEMKTMENLHKIQETKIKLDVGGQIHTTSIQTLRRDEESMLSAMFSGRYEMTKEADGSYFIDRDGTYFRYILNFLRDGYIDSGTIPSAMVLKELLREAKYYQLGELCKYLDKLRSTEFTNGN